ncbi:MAG: oxidoreductase [Acidobacteria bacterium]|nr:oxidoreductase [Acidobacteriota bacterium]
MDARKPKLAVYKFASCDGCQLAMLNLEDELLDLAGAVEIAYFLEARSQTMEGPFDVTLVEGSVTTREEAERIREVRKNSKYLITIGACATAGGIQALRNWKDVDEFIRIVYATPAYIETLKESTPISAHVAVDFELYGCPINKYQLLEVLTALLIGRTPHLPAHSVCVECKRRGTVCVTVAQGIPCVGPLTHAGCGAICPAYNRGCYGCFGPMESPNPDSLMRHLQGCGVPRGDLVRLLRGFTGYAEAFRTASEKLEKAP